jgi:hypothetical protein
MKKLILFIVSGMLLLAGGASAQYAAQIVPGGVNNYLKEGYSINSIIRLDNNSWVYHLTKNKEIVSCSTGIASGNNLVTVCFKP